MTPAEEKSSVRPEPLSDVMQAGWYYATENGMVGPLALEALAEAAIQGNIKPDSAVWHAEFGDEWRAASEVVELKKALRAASAAQLEELSRRKVVIEPLQTALSQAIKTVTAVLFKPGSVAAWLSLALCDMMASARMMAGINSTAAPPSIGGGATAAEAITALYEYLRAGVIAIFEPRFSYAWLLSIVIYGLFTSYVAAKGRLLLVGKTYMPDEPLALLWRRTLDRTSSLWRYCFLLDFLLNIAFFILLYKGFASDMGVGAGGGETLWSAPSFRWFASAFAVAAVFEFIRTAVYHFVEPLVFVLGVPVSDAVGMVMRALCVTRNAVARVTGFFALVAAFRLAYFVAVFLLAMVLPSPVVLPIAMLLMVPVDFLIRALGAHLVVVPAEGTSTGDELTRPS